MLALTTGADGVTRRALWQDGRVTSLGPENDQQAAQGDLNNRGSSPCGCAATRPGPGTPASSGAGDPRARPAARPRGPDQRGRRHRRPATSWSAPRRTTQGRIRPVGHGGGRRDLGTLGGPHGAATVINDRDEVAGYAETATGEQPPGALGGSGRIIDLTTRGVPGSAAVVDLNRPGQMIAADGRRAIFIG